MSGVGPEVLERMIALVKRASNTFADERHHGEWLSIALEADRIVALLPKPVDADEQYARDLISEQGWQPESVIRYEDVVQMIVMALRGRALAAGDR